MKKEFFKTITSFSPLAIVIALTIGTLDFARADRWGSGGYTAPAAPSRTNTNRTRATTTRSQTSSSSQGTTSGATATDAELWQQYQLQAESEGYGAQSAPAAAPVVSSNSNVSHSGSSSAGPGASAYSNGSTQIFDDGTTLQQFDDGSTLATGTDGSVRSSDATDGTLGRSAASSGGGEGTLNSCESDASTARSACTTPGTAGMDSGTAAMYTMMLYSQLPQMATKIASVGKNMSQQCKLQADVSTLMTAINGIKGGACATYISKCNSSCNKEATDNDTQAAELESTTYGASAAQIYRQAARRNRMQSNTCKGYQGEVVGMMYAAMQNGGNIVVNKQCEKDLAALGAQPGASLPPLPTVGDCSDPNNQTVTCICGREGNSKLPLCAGFTPPGSVAGAGTATPNGSGTLAMPYASKQDTTGDDGNTADPFASGDKKKAGNGPNGQGDGGGAAPSGSGLASLASEGGGPGGPGDKSSAITGTSGGNSSGLGSAGGGGGGGGFGRGLAGNGGGGNSFLDKFNLRKFLPGSKFKTRGIAGMSVKSVDGITGPMGPSIWEKATRQYQEQIQKQNVILEK